MNPIIGIIICGFMDNRQFVSQPYIQAVEDAGGVPVVLPCTQEKTIYSHFGRICDGFLFCGGDDVTPLLFGEELVTQKGTTDLKTDIFHLSFMEYALSLNLPIFAICRGMQLLNIVLGGTIYQDISLRPDTSLNHMQLSESREDICHKVTFSNSSMLYNICGNSLFTNSFHHQCIKTIGTNLHITGITSDGIVESIESTSHPFVIGVQWHPECMYQFSQPMDDLFYKFISFAKTAKVIKLPEFIR